jgi:hypothetical protein
MSHRLSGSLRLPKIYAALFTGAALMLAAGAAQAFTFENGNSSGGSSSLAAPSPFNDPAKTVETGPNATTKMQYGNTSIYIGNQGSTDRDFRNGMDRMFSPLGRPPN